MALLNYLSAFCDAPLQYCHCNMDLNSKQKVTTTHPPSVFCIEGTSSKESTLAVIKQFFKYCYHCKKKKKCPICNSNAIINMQT